MEAKTKQYIQDCYPIDQWIEQGFEAGKAEGRREVEDYHTDCFRQDMANVMNMGKQAGIKEVVDWLIENDLTIESGDIWQAKLQEWGIKED